MSHAEVKNIAHSVNVRLKNLAVQKQISFDYILLRYALERFLFRLSVSQHANRFILKGASAFAVWMGPVFRVTRDADYIVPAIRIRNFYSSVFVKFVCRKSSRMV